MILIIGYIEIYDSLILAILILHIGKAQATVFHTIICLDGNLTIKLYLSWASSISSSIETIGSLPISTKYLSSASLERLVILLLILSCLINILLPFYLEFFEVFLCILKPPHGFGVQRYEKKCNYVVI